MSTFLFQDRLKILKKIGKEIETCDYFLGGEEDVILQFPLQRLQEYFDFFQALNVICPEDQLDYYYRSCVIQELKSLIITVKQQMDDIIHYQNLQHLLSTVQGVPVCIHFNFIKFYTIINKKGNRNGF